MFRHFNVEAFVFWWLNSVMAIFALLWVAKKIADFLEHREKLRKKLDFFGLSTIGIIYLYCLFSYVRTLG